MADVWVVVKSELFAKQMKRHSRNAEMLRKLDELLELFQHTDDLGESETEKPDSSAACIRPDYQSRTG